MPFWPNSLVQEIAERRAIFFVGAGLSKVARSEFPTWPALLITLSAQLKKKKDKTLVHQLVRRGNMLDAAQIIRDCLSKADLYAYIREIFQIRPIPHHEMYENLLKMDPKVIVTTNYDELLEKNFEHYSGGSEAHSISVGNTEHLINDLRSPIRSIIKMHGCVSNPAQVVLDRSSFFDLRRRNQPLIHTIQALMTIHTVVFLGYSINDPDIQLILENVNISTSSDNPHYALMSKFDHASLRNAHTSAFNIQFLEYATGQHEQVPDLIAELSKEVHNLRLSRKIV